MLAKVQGERGVEALGGHEGELDAPAAGFGEGAELGCADFDEGEFGGDEEAVEEDEEGDEPERYAYAFKLSARRHPPAGNASEGAE